MSVPTTVKRRQHQDDEVGRIHVLTQDRLEQHGTQRRQAQHYRHDNAPAYQGRQQVADRAYQRVYGHPNRVLDDQSPRGQS